VPLPDPVIVAHRLVAVLAVLLLTAATLLSGAPVVQATVSGAAGPAATGPRIAITDALSSAHLGVAPGETVTWVNRDDEPHAVMAMGGDVAFDSGALAPGETWSYTFRTPGDVSYHDPGDARNPAYVGMVMVEPARGAVTASTAGTALAPLAAVQAPAVSARPAFLVPGTLSGTQAVSDDDDEEYDEGGQAGPMRWIVEIHNKNEYRPGRISIPVGASVTWFNDDSHTHTVSGSGGINSGDMHRDDTYSRTFDTEGTFDYICAYHSQMRGTVVVGDGEGPAAPAPPPPGGGGGSDTPVSIGDNFSPRDVTISAGDSVTWTNNDSSPHTATGNGFDSGMLTQGQRYSHTFAQSGTYDYVCSYHSDMSGTITVTGGDGGGTPPPPPPDDGGGTPAPPPDDGGGTPPSDGGGSDAPAQAAVSIGDDFFRPGDVTVAPGGTVTWTHNGSSPHTVTGNGFDSGMLTGGQRYSHTFGQAGTYRYQCVYHSGMTGTITVTGGGDTPPPPPPDDGGGTPAPPPDDGGGTPPPDGDGGTDAPARAAVSIGDDFFRPGNVSIATGGTVTWTHTGSAPHTVTGNGFDSGMLTGGQRFSKRFAKAGTYRYLCSYHSGMTGTVTVGGGGGGGNDTPPPPPRDDPPPPPPRDNPPAPGDGGGDSNAPARASVKIGDDFFSPRTVTVSAGGTVTWTHTGSAPHTVTGNGFDSGMLTGGQRFSKRFAKAGTYRYQCVYHSGMTGTVKVMSASGKVPPGGGGTGGGGGGPRGGGSGGGGGGTGGGGGAPSPGSQTHTVTMGSSSFSPSSLSARVGDTVIFKNASSVPHNVVPFTSAPIMGGQSYETVLREQGTINYKCEFHSGMTGTITVAAAPAGTKLPPPSAGGLSGGSGSGSLPSSTGSGGGSSGGGAPAPGAESHTITMVNSTFDPQVLQARVGDEVTWVNEDPVPHNVTGGPLNSGMMMGGDEFTTVLTEAGTIEYECTLHPGMTGTLEVAEALPGTEVPPASSSTTSDGDTAGGSGGTPSAKPGAGSENHQVEIVDFLYQPDPLEVNVGDTVTFVNKDAAPHTATADDKSWDSGNLNQGDSWTLDLKEAGEVPYFCIYHPNMTGTLIVKPKGEETAPPSSSTSSDTTATMSAGQVAGIGSGWVALLAFLAGLQLHARWGARRRESFPV
jgi:plastocyanin